MNGLFTIKMYSQPEVKLKHWLSVLLNKMWVLMSNNATLFHTPYKYNRSIAMRTRTDAKLHNVQYVV